MSIGQKLKAAREEKGLTCMEVADATNMLVQMVREIEADDFHRFTAPVYGKGFIKLFARAVGLDPAPLIAEYIKSQNEAAEAPKSTVPISPPKSAPLPIPIPAQIKSTPEDADKATEADAKIPPPDRHKKRLKASTVTMPRADSPFAPANRPPPRQPAAPQQRLADDTDENARANTRHPETPRDTQTFTLESDTVAPDELPKPVEKPHESFQYPTRAKPASSADVSTDQAKPKRKIFRSPKPERYQLITLAKISRGIALLKEIFLTFRSRIATAVANNNDEDSRIRSRYAMTAVLVCVSVLAVIIIAVTGSGRKTNSEKSPAADATVAHVQHTPAEKEAETLPEKPVPIVRVLPAPKMFAR